MQLQMNRVNRFVRTDFGMNLSRCNVNEVTRIQVDFTNDLRSYRTTRFHFFLSPSIWRCSTHKHTHISMRNERSIRWIIFCSFWPHKELTECDQSIKMNVCTMYSRLDLILPWLDNQLNHKLSLFTVSLFCGHNYVYPPWKQFLCFNGDKLPSASRPAIYKSVFFLLIHFM